MISSVFQACLERVVQPADEAQLKEDLCFLTDALRNQEQKAFAVQHYLVDTLVEHLEKPYQTDVKNLCFDVLKSLCLIRSGRMFLSSDLVFQGVMRAVLAPGGELQTPAVELLGLLASFHDVWDFYAKFLDDTTTKLTALLDPATPSLSAAVFSYLRAISVRCSTCPPETCQKMVDIVN